MVWNADLYLETGFISRLHPALDFLLYGVDLIEIVSIINVGMIMYSLIQKRRKKSAEKTLDEFKTQQKL
jgi:flagellar biosynthesis protein FliR